MTKREDWPLRPVPEAGNVWRYVPSWTGAIQRRVERIERLEHVERGRVSIEHLPEERRAAALIRQNNHRLGLAIHEWLKWRLNIFNMSYITCIEQHFLRINTLTRTVTAPSNIIRPYIINIILPWFCHYHRIKQKMKEMKNIHAWMHNT